jgi:hypothetical protein
LAGVVEGVAAGGMLGCEPAGGRTGVGVIGVTGVGVAALGTAGLGDAALGVAWKVIGAPGPSVAGAGWAAAGAHEEQPGAIGPMAGPQALGTPQGAHEVAHGLQELTQETQGLL